MNDFQVVPGSRRPMVLIPVDNTGQGTLGLGSDIVIDTRPAYVMDVSSSKPNGMSRCRGTLFTYRCTRAKGCQESALLHDCDVFVCGHELR